MLLSITFALLFQVVAITPNETISLAIAGFVASFLLSIFKRYANENTRWLKGATAHFITLLLAIAISLVALWYQGGLNSFNDVVKSMAIVVASAVSTFHFLVAKLGIENKDTDERKP